MPALRRCSARLLRRGPDGATALPGLLAPGTHQLGPGAWVWFGRSARVLGGEHASQRSQVLILVRRGEEVTLQLRPDRGWTAQDRPPGGAQLVVRVDDPRSNEV